MRDFCYQLLSINGKDYEAAIGKTKETALRTVEIMVGNFREFLALQLDLEHLVDFDDLVANIFNGLDVNYVVFADIDFKRIIEFAERLNVFVNNISVSTPDSMFVNEIEDEKNTIVDLKNHKALLQAIHENELSVRNINITFNKICKLKVYNSGIVCTENTDLVDSVELVNLLKEVLIITKGVFTDD